MVDFLTDDELVEGGVYSSMDDVNEWYIYRGGRLIEMEPEEVKLMMEKAEAEVIH